MNIFHNEHMFTFPKPYPVKPFSPLSEENYSETMDMVVLPILAHCREDDWTSVEGEFVDLKGITSALPSPVGIHSVYYNHHDFAHYLEKIKIHRGYRGITPNSLPLQRPCQDIIDSSAMSRGTIFISIGFSESEIKFEELAWYFLQYGFDVVIIEHRGHGYSAREISQPSIVSIASWKTYESDFLAVMQHIRSQYDIPRPFYLYGHSMGGGIGAALLEDCPFLFQGAVLSAPMIAPRVSLPVTLLRYATECITLLGFGKKVIKDKNHPTNDGQNHSAWSQIRLQWYHSHRLADPHLHLENPNYQWAREALRMNHYIMKWKNISHIKTPTLVFQAGDDIWVSNHAQNAFVQKARCMHAPLRFYHIGTARHEIFNDTPTIMAKYLRSVMSFYLSDDIV